PDGGRPVHRGGAQAGHRPDAHADAAGILEGDPFDRRGGGGGRRGGDDLCRRQGVLFLRRRRGRRRPAGTRKTAPVLRRAAGIGQERVGQTGRRTNGG